MPRADRTSSAADPRTDAPRPTPDPGSMAPATVPSPAPAGLGSLADLPVAGLTRRRIALLLGSLVAAWMILLFARQVGEASAATSRADGMRAANVALQDEVAALEDELTLIQRQAYIGQQAREYRLGEPREIPFVLADDAPPLPSDAPGTAAVRLGAVIDRPSPAASWIRLLFGPGGDPADVAGSAPGG
jgi:cell division protein FtsB